MPLWPFDGASPPHLTRPGTPSGWVSGVAVLLARRLPFQQFQQGFHLGHHAPHFASLREESVFLDALMHLAELLADVAQVTHDLLTLRLRYGKGFS